MIDNILSCGDFKYSISHAEGEKDFYIALSKENRLLKMKISDYLSTVDYLDTIKSFGKINYDKYAFRECPLDINEKRKYIVTGENKNILTKSGTDGQWMELYANMN